MFSLDDQAKFFGITAVENLFFTEYMPAADGEQIKVYLMGLFRSQRGEKDYGIQEMAKELGMEEHRVLAALRYWERRRLVERVGDQPPSYVFHHLGHRMLTGQDNMTGDELFVQFSEAVYTQFEGRRKLRPNDIALAFEWVADLGLPQEVVLMLLNHMADTRGVHFSFKSAQSLAVMMKEDGITGPEDAEKYLSHNRRTHFGAKAVLGQFNLRRLPTEPELALYRKWTQEWGFEDKAILTACQQTTAASNPTFSYLNGILERLKNQQAGTSSQALSAHLKDEAALVDQAKKVMDTLGVFSVNVHSILAPYQELLEQYSAEMILLAAKSVRANHGLFQDLEPKLISWKQLGLRDEGDVVRHLKELKAYEPAMFKVFETCGMRSRAGEVDLMKYKNWIEEGHSEAIILEAATQARSAVKKLPYIQSRLDDWKKKGVTTPEAAREDGKKAAARKRKVAFQDYNQEQTETNANFGPDLLKEARDLNGE
jgi:DNA replication protein DnaD